MDWHGQAWPGPRPGANDLPGCARSRDPRAHRHRPRRGARAPCRHPQGRAGACRHVRPPRAGRRSWRRGRQEHRRRGVALRPRCGRSASRRPRRVPASSAGSRSAACSAPPRRPVQDRGLQRARAARRRGRPAAASTSATRPRPSASLTSGCMVSSTVAAGVSAGGARQARDRHAAAPASVRSRRPAVRRGRCRGLPPSLARSISSAVPDSAASRLFTSWRTGRARVTSRSRGSWLIPALPRMVSRMSRNNRAGRPPPATPSIGVASSLPSQTPMTSPRRCR